eukprot:12576012-Alexandrium_andersonii.AAC.1
MRASQMRTVSCDLAGPPESRFDPLCMFSAGAQRPPSVPAQHVVCSVLPERQAASAATLGGRP